MKGELIVVIGAGDPRRNVVLGMIGEMSRVVAMSYDELEALQVYAGQALEHPGKLRFDDLESVLSRHVMFDPGEKVVAAPRGYVYSSRRSRAGRAARWS